MYNMENADLEKAFAAQKTVWNDYYKPIMDILSGKSYLEAIGILSQVQDVLVKQRDETI